jgi:hypothetical protein
MSDWMWVWLSWSQLVVAYSAYLFYLNWRARKAREEDQ